MNLKKTVLLGIVAVVLELLIAIIAFFFQLKSIQSISRALSYVEIQYFIGSLLSVIACLLFLFFILSILNKNKGVNVLFGLGASIIYLSLTLWDFYYAFFICEGESSFGTMYYFSFFIKICSAIAFYMMFLFQNKETSSSKILKICFALLLFCNLVLLAFSIFSSYENFAREVNEYHQNSKMSYYSFFEYLIFVERQRLIYLVLYPLLYISAKILFLLFYLKLLLNVDKVAETFKKKYRFAWKKFGFIISGAILGLPLSYFFQSEGVREFVGGLGGYIQHLDDVLAERELLNNVIIGVLFFALVGFAVGYFVNKLDEQKKIK